ncbi:hypothetical protein V1498_20480 [Peribacillus sp. SCS-26]|uniref:hypothetical protein n=1 Tax=Paraperibacillus marinus TaxID=3115295 RepID=UPI0039061924
MLTNVCSCQVTGSIKVEADYDAEPLWCHTCGWNLDIDEFPLSETIKDELFEWQQHYGVIPIKEHNVIGLNLTEKVKEELGSDYTVVFIPIDDGGIPLQM